jgi:hypothetical protein
MEPPRVRVRQGGVIGGGLLITTQVQIAYVGVPESVTPAPLASNFVFLRVPAVSPSALATPAFLNANNADVPATKEEGGQKAKKKKKKIHPLVVMQSSPPGPRGNSLIIMDRTLHLTLDRPAFHELGIPVTNGRGKKHGLGSRVHLPLRLPLKESGRAVRALAAPRIPPMDMVLSCGAKPAVPPVTAEGQEVATLHGAEIFEMRDMLPQELCNAAVAVTSERMASDWDLMDAMDSAERILTGLAIGDDGVEAQVRVFRRRYVGLCNGDLWDSVLQSAVASLKAGVGDFAVIGARGMWSANVNYDSEGFGGESGVVAIVPRTGKAVTYEIRPKSDLT